MSSLGPLHYPVNIFHPLLWKHPLVTNVNAWSGERFAKLYATGIGIGVLTSQQVEQLFHWLVDTKESIQGALVWRRHGLSHFSGHVIPELGLQRKSHVHWVARWLSWCPPWRKFLKSWCSCAGELELRGHQECLYKVAFPCYWFGGLWPGK